MPSALAACISGVAASTAAEYTNRSMPRWIGGAVVGQDGDAEVAQTGRQLRVLAEVEGAVGALDGVAPGPHELGEGVHAGASDA